jgi:hypothetical protein
VHKASPSPPSPGKSHPSQGLCPRAPRACEPGPRLTRPYGPLLASPSTPCVARFFTPCAARPQPHSWAATPAPSLKRSRDLPTRTGQRAPCPEPLTHFDPACAPALPDTGPAGFVSRDLPLRNCGRAHEHLTGSRYHQGGGQRWACLVASCQGTGAGEPRARARQAPRGRSPPTDADGGAGPPQPPCCSP